jgi:hypothetical protein
MHSPQRSTKTKATVVLPLSLANGHVVSRLDLPADGDGIIDPPGSCLCQTKRSHWECYKRLQCCNRLRKWETNQTLGRQQSPVVNRHVFVNVCNGMQSYGVSTNTKGVQRMLSILSRYAVHIIIPEPKPHIIRACMGRKQTPTFSQPRQGASSTNWP